MELTHSVEIQYEKILHKQFDYAPGYSGPINTKIAEMVASGKTDGKLYFLPDDVKVARNFNNLDSAMEWCSWIVEYNTAHPDMVITKSQIRPEKFEYVRTTSQTDDDERASKAAALVEQLSST
jgi:hypothetical protein